MIRIVITKYQHGVEADVRRWTPRDCLWIIKTIRHRRHNLRHVLRTLLTGVSLCSFGVPADVRPDEIFYLALQEAEKQREMGMSKRISVQFRYCFS